MKGHEYARSLVKSHLATYMPRMLAKIRTDLDVSSPVDPKSILLADVLPDDPSLYPCILVQATTLDPPTAANSGPVDTQYLCEYGLTIVCAAALHVLDDFVGASVNRDRMLLAARMAMMSHPKLAEDAQALVPKTLTERTGQSIQDLQGRPMAIGVMEFTVRVLESLEDDLGEITSSVVTVTGEPSNLI